MNAYSARLLKGAQETRDYIHDKADLSPPKEDWLELADDMEKASRMGDLDDVETMIDALGYRIIDGFPITEDFAPSFSQALDAFQRKRKKLKK